ncbi:MAG: chorismate lyase [Candidatus Endonucleobacter bathymodioli]|uniref:Probable chorismate pyruvate-lyase n=1 Tax=Candidatus Endonucleibacter bathymodioli TaxID=539814 RepID=A0AA90NWE0_9GAMM|nr:chorismate lyase [Candidatus Endonucleobacter bathymodioli]
MSFFHHSNLSWQPFRLIREALPADIKDLLLDRGSLTEKLKKKYRDAFTVSVIRHSWAKPSLSEQQFLGNNDSEFSIREVLLICGGRPRVFARSVFPRCSVNGPNEGLLKLGNKPLGEFLFSHINLTRGAIELAKLPASQFNKHLGYQYTDETTWGRRSLLHLNDKPISVCEFFLPEPKQ